MDDAVWLSRVQFGLTIAFHYIFPPLNIGLGLMLVIMEGLWLRTGKAVYEQMARFWALAFGLMFALGVASGVVMEFQFGTNWSNYSRYVGDVFGSALAAEGIFAFFLESGFLGLVLFGWGRVRPKVHYLATVLVALGAHFSAIWIVIANSWQQTPAGHTILVEDGRARAVVESFYHVVFNPSFLQRISHVFSAAWLAGAFLVLSVSAWYLLRNRHIEFGRAGIKIALLVAAGSSIFQLATGHFSAEQVAATQPEKLAAFEGHYQTGPADMHLLGWVDEQAEQVRYAITIPRFLSFLVHGNFTDPVPGLREWPPEDRPPVNPVFQLYHAMVGIGLSLIFISLTGLVYWWRDSLFERRWYLWVLVFSVLLPVAANQFGWFAAELGRQPWAVYHLLRTADAGSPVVSADSVLASLIGFGLIYLLLFALFIYLLNEKIQHGPGEPAAAEQEKKAGLIKEGHRA